MMLKPRGIRQPRPYPRAAGDGTDDNSRTVEEPCEVNVSSTVLNGRVTG